MIAYAAGKPHHGETLASCLQSIAEAVVSIHYSGYPGRKELISIGIEKALTLLKADFFDPRKNIRGFLYTSIRNEVGNYLRKEARSVAVESTSRHFGASPFMSQDCHWEIEYERIHGEIRNRLRACGVMDDRYHDTARGAALYRAIL